MESVVDIKEIMELLPHRYPFILVDRVIEIVPEKSILALKNVTINEPFFQGHFPGEPVMPGVLIMEALAQAGGVLAFKSRPQQKKGSKVYFMSMDKVRFRKIVTPGDQLMLDVKVLRLKEKVIKLAGVAKVDDAVVAEAELMAMFGESE